MLDLHLDWVVLHVNVHNAFNSVAWSTICRSYSLHLVLWIKFSQLFDDFMCAHPHYIFFKLPNMEIS
jgi:hypothetical protein